MYRRFALYLLFMATISQSTICLGQTTDTYWTIRWKNPWCFFLILSVVQYVPNMRIEEKLTETRMTLLRLFLLVDYSLSILQLFLLETIPIVFSSNTYHSPKIHPAWLVSLFTSEIIAVTSYIQCWDLFHPCLCEMNIHHQAMFLVLMNPSKIMLIILSKQTEVRVNHRKKNNLD